MKHQRILKLINVKVDDLNALKASDSKLSKIYQIPVFLVDLIRFATDPLKDEDVRRAWFDSPRKLDETEFKAKASRQKKLVHQWLERHYGDNYKELIFR